MKPVNGNLRAQPALLCGRRQLGALFRAAGALALVGALTGCLESADTINFQPGIYQGAPDPLVSDAAALEARFKGQTDR